VFHRSQSCQQFHVIISESLSEKQVTQ